MKLLLPLLFATALHAQSHVAEFNGWRHLPQTIEVSNFGDIVFSDLVFTPRFNGLQMVADGELVVTFPQRIWGLSAILADQQTGHINVVPLDEPAGIYHFSFAGLHDESRVRCHFVPEPSTALLSLLALPLMLRRRR